MYFSKTTTVTALFALFALFQLTSAAPVVEPAENITLAIRSPLELSERQVQNGEVTVYDAYGGFGACGGLLSDDGGFTAAVSVKIWGSDIWEGNINYNPYCGRRARITLSGKTVEVVVQDKCMGCEANDIDINRAAWNQLTGEAYGDRYQCTWTWI